MRTNERHLVASAVAFELKRAQRSEAWLSERSGIALPTLVSRLREQEDFTIVDLANIAAALEISVTFLTPSAGPSGR